MSSQPASSNYDLPPEQAASQAKCVHPNGTFVEFTKDETEQSVIARFEKQVLLFSRRATLLFFE